MFNSKKRALAKLDELKSLLGTVRFVLDDRSTDRGSLYRSYLSDLDEALMLVTAEAVLVTEEDYATVVETAVHAKQELSSRADEFDRQQKAKRDAALAVVSRANDQWLRPCCVCHGHSLLVRDRAIFEVYGGDVEVKIIICLQCGDVRMNTRSPESLKALELDTLYRRVDLPEKADGPYR